MNRPHFVQIHSLSSYPGTLLNRDASGMAKRLPFGGSTRTRISSQCLKRHWRFAGTEGHESASGLPYSMQSLGLPMGQRTKELVETRLLPRPDEQLPPLHPKATEALVEKLVTALYGDKAADVKKRQALFFGEPEIDYLGKLVREIWTWAAGVAGLAYSESDLSKDALKALEEKLKTRLSSLRDNLRELKHGAGLESALFGRLVTSDTRSNRDAPVHVAHALTVHAMERDLDFVTAVDDLRRNREDADAGSAGIFDTELTSGLYYGYVVIDVPLLVSNLAEDAAMAGKVAARLLHLITRVSPGAKKGSTAPYSWAEWLMVETGDDQPRTLANAFRRPVPLRGGGVFEGAMEALNRHLTNLDKVYGVHERTQRRQMSVTPPEVEGIDSVSLNALDRWLEEQVKG